MKIPKCLLPAVLLVILIHPACKKSLPAAGGNTLEKTVVTASGTTESTQTDLFVYNNQNQLVESIMSSTGTGLAGSDTVTFQYDASGRLTSFIQGGPTGPLCRYDLGYNSNGQIVTATAAPLLPDILFQSFSYGYNAEGQLTSDSVLEQALVASPSLAVVQYDVYTYDENGNVIADTVYLSSNTPPFGLPFAAAGITHYQYDTHVNPYYNMGIPLAAPVLGYAQVLSKNNVVSVSSTYSSTRPYGFSYSYYSNARPRTQVLVATGTSGAGGAQTTYTTEYFYQ
jgi:YD repeat-containing protein